MCEILVIRLFGHLRNKALKFHVGLREPKLALNGGGGWGLEAGGRDIFKGFT